MGQFPPLKAQRGLIRPLVVADLTGKVVCVTGANTGLGFETAKHFARMNPEKLILTSRDQEKGDKALKELVEETNFQRAEVWLLDLTSFASVRQFADRALKLDRFDYLVENAGTLPGTTRVLTEDGWEIGLQVNNLSQELLALLLVPKMLETAKRFSVVTKLVVVASDAHYWVTEEPELMNATNILETLSSEKYCSVEANMSKRYAITKLINLFFVRAISAHLPSSLLVNAVNPGFCTSELRRDVPSGTEEAKRWDALEQKLGLTTEEGGRNIVYGVTGGYGNPEEEEKLRAKFIYLSRVMEESDFALSKAGYEMQNRIWDETLEILTKVDPRVGDLVREHHRKRASKL
ncbi:hypothetical protein C8J56DRAFT_1043599 [Mycena floridula]|nr:hypothetical protein C8J56DRAFT_1043599 [Mycena floridula]